MDTQLSDIAKKLAEELGFKAEDIIAPVMNAQLSDANQMGYLRNMGSIPHVDFLDAFDPNSPAERGYQTRFTKWRGNVIFRPDELSLWTGINGHGKTQFLGQVILDLIENGAKVCIASLEMNKRRLIQRLCRQISGYRLPSPEYLKAIKDHYDNKIIFFDYLGSVNQQDLFRDFETAHNFLGVDVFVIDSLMKCGLAEDDYNEQKRFVDLLCNFKSKFKCHIHLVAHPRKGVDESAAPGKMDIKGTGTISDLADNCFSVWRNKPKEEAIAQGDTSDERKAEYDGAIRCNKQRNGEWEGFMPIWFHKESMQYLEFQNAKPHQYVPYSKQDEFSEYLSTVPTF